MLLKVHNQFLLTNLDLKTNYKYKTQIYFLVALPSGSILNTSKNLICSGHFTCCHTEIVVVDPVSYQCFTSSLVPLSQVDWQIILASSPSHSTPTSGQLLQALTLTPGAWRGSQYSTKSQYTSIRPTPPSTDPNTRCLAGQSI